MRPDDIVASATALSIWAGSACSAVRAIAGSGRGERPDGPLENGRAVVNEVLSSHAPAVRLRAQPAQVERLSLTSPLEVVALVPAVVVPVALAAWSVVGVYERWQKARGLAAAGRKTDAEARKTDSEGRKIVAETDRTRAETERIRAEIDEARARSLSEQAITHLVLGELGIKPRSTDWLLRSGCRAVDVAGWLAGWLGRWLGRVEAGCWCGVGFVDRWAWRGCVRSRGDGVSLKRVRAALGGVEGST